MPWVLVFLAALIAVNPHLVCAESNPRIALTPAEQAWIAKKHAIRVRVVHFPPFFIVKNDRQPTGVCFDYLQLIAERTGVNFQYDITTQPFTEALEGLKQHRGPDLIATMMRTPERAMAIAFTNEYNRTPRVIFTRDDGPFISDVRDLSGKVVSLQRGSVVHQEIKQNHADISLLPFATDAESLNAVSMGEADAYIGNLAVGSYLILQNGLLNLRVAAPSKMEDHVFSMGIRNDWPELSRILNKGLASISPDERLRIRNKYLAVRYEHGIRAVDIVKWVLGVSSVLTIIILLFYYANRKLKTEIAGREIAEDNFKKSEDTAVALLNATTESAFLIKPDGTIITMNDVTAERLGEPIEKLIGKRSYDLVPPDLARSRKKIIDEAIRSKKAIRFEDERSGIILDNNVYPIVDPDGNVSRIAVFARDITKQKQAEAAIRENERFLASILDSIQDGICVLNPDLTIVHANKTMQTMYAPHVPIENKKCYEIYRGIQQPCKDCPTLQSIHTRKLEMQEVPYVKDGKEIGVLEVYAFPLFDEDNNLKGAVEYIRDISLRKQAEEALKESENRLKSFYHAAFEGIAITEQGKIVDYNRQFADIFGYTNDELIGKETIELVAEEDRALVSENIRSGYEKPYDHKALTKDGAVIYVEVHGQPIQYEGRPARVTAIHDLTEKKIAEEALQKSERNMSSVLNNTQDAVVRIDKHLRHIFANPALYEATGFSPDQYLGKTNEEIGMPEDLCAFWREKHESVFRNKAPQTFEFNFRTANKGERVYQAVVTPEFDKSDAVETIVSFMRDITDLKDAESEKNAIIAKLESALAEIKTLRGFIPICAQCKNIRDDKGYWQQIEEYIQDRSDAQFSHSLCPKCARELYPDMEFPDDRDG